MGGGQDVFFRDFSKGVVAHLAPTKLTDVASPRAFNTAFLPMAGGTLGVGPRPGYREVAYGMDDDEQIIAQAFFEYTESGVTTTHHIGVRSDGTLWALGSPTSLQLTIPTGPGEFASASLGDVSQGVVFVQARNRLLGFVRGGLPFKIYRKPASSTLYVGTVGLPAPSAVTFNSEVAGNMTGALDIRVAWYNSATATESSPSEVLTRDVTAKDVTINLPTNPPAEADKIRIYVRNQRLSTKYARNAAMEVTAGTTTFLLDFTDAQFNQMTLSGAPTLTAYNQPASGQLCAEWHLSRLFISDGHTLRYSQVGNPEQFDPLAEELVNAGAGELILGLLSLSEDGSGLLGIFKESSVHGMTGQTVATWEFDELVPDLGCISTASLCRGDGFVGFWSKRGPVAWLPGSAPTVLTHETLSGLIKDGDLYVGRRDQCKAAFDPQGRRLLFTLDRTDGSPFTVAPWSTMHRVWEAIAWDLGSIYSLIAGPSAANEERIFFGGPQSVVYELSNTLRRDAAAEDSADAYRRITAGTTAGVTLESGAPTVNPRGSMARLIDLTTLQIHRSSYTLVGTALSWDTPSSFTPAVNSIVLFDGPVCEWDTVDSVIGAPHFEKRVLQTYAEVWTTGDVPILIGLYKNASETPHKHFETIIAKNAKDRDREGPVLSAAKRTHKRWGGYRAQWTRVRFVGWYPLCEWSLVHLGFSVVHHDDED